MPTAAPTPTPVPVCTVPNFFNFYYNANPSASLAWGTVANFTGALIDDADGKRIKTQSLQPGTVIPCTSTMTVDDKNTYPYP